MKSPFVSYSSLIDKKRIVKKSNILIIIPTYKAPDEVITCVKSLRTQTGLHFDILIVDNGKDDYKQVLKKYPLLNFVSLKKNTGSAGGFRIGGEIGLHYKYEYLIFADEELMLMKKTTLKRLKKVLDSSVRIGAVGPTLVGSKEATMKKLIPGEGIVSFCMFTKAEAVQKAGFHNMHLFWLGDDVDLSLRINRYYEEYYVPGATYFHPSFSPGRMTTFYVYFVTRALLYLSLFAPVIRMRSKLKLFYYFILKAGQSFLSAISYRDISYIQAVLLAVIGAFHIEWDLRKYVMKNKYYLQPLKSRPKGKSVFFTNTSVLNKNRYYFMYLEPNKKAYFELAKY